MNGIDFKAMKGKKPEGFNAGESNANAIMNEEKVRAIRWSKGKITQQELADIYGISKSTISRIQSHKIWKHVQ